MRARLYAPLSVVAFATLLAACGSKGSAPISASATTAGGATSVAPAAAVTSVAGQDAGGQGGNGQNSGRRAALQAYRDCLSGHGVSLPTRPSNPPSNNGQAGNGQASSGQAGSGQASSGQAGNGQAGSGRASNGQNGQAAPDPNGPPPGADQNGPPPSFDPNGAPPTDANGQPVQPGQGGGFGGGGFGGIQSVINDPANKAAVDACASLLPAGGFGNGPGGGPGGQAFQAYVSCLRDNGVDIPTTTAPGGPPPSIDRNAPAFAAANEKCQVLLPQRNGNGNGGSGSATTTTTAAG